MQSRNKELSHEVGWQFKYLQIMTVVLMYEECDCINPHNLKSAWQAHRVWFEQEVKQSLSFITLEIQTT